MENGEWRIENGELILNFAKQKFKIFHFHIFTTFTIKKDKMENYIDIKDLTGEIFLILLFLGISIGAVVADKIIKKGKK